MIVPSASPPVSGAMARSRLGIASSSAPSSSSSSCAGAAAYVPLRVVPLRPSFRRCVVGVCSSKPTATAELAEGRELRERSRGIGIPSFDAAEKEVSQSRPFLNAQSEEELLFHVQREVELGRLPLKIAATLREIYYNYRNAVLQSGNSEANEIILSNIAATFDRVMLEVEDPFTFLPYHKAVREPFDYYMFGQNYFRPLIDFRKSYVGNIPIFHEVEHQLRKGHNVILISNHQSEADPAIISLLLEKTNSFLSENMTFVAGDRVVTDPVCKPFSMGRNLVCVYSKKHMNDVPELAEVKRRANTRSLKEMALLLRNGGQLIWIAPSGGRDRPDPQTGEWHPATFDPASVNNIRRLADHAGVTRHIYPLCLLCYDIMPPPPQVEKQIGERRFISFHGVGMSIGSEADSNAVAGEEDKEAFSGALYNSVCEQYSVLKSAVYGDSGLAASTSTVSLSQPWT
ncbi:phospholipid/glycerol acyltransferase family protein [Wolffia australiana]